LKEEVTVYTLIIVPLKGWNSSNIWEKSESKLYSERNLEQIKVRECFLSFGAKCFVFQFAI
jgi:hypothetical protein